MQPTAHWIWLGQQPACPYNQIILARRTFRVPASLTHATLAITADSAYRLRINGQWVGDGPGRAWPEHYQFDQLEVTGWLREGENQIEIMARFFGTGTFHQVPRRPGLLAELTMTGHGGKVTTLKTDRRWEVALAPGWKSETPKISIQMEPFEQYDARREDDLRWEPATVVCAAGRGPWKGLHPRDCALLTRQPVPLRALAGPPRVVARPAGHAWSMPICRLLHGGKVEANHSVGTGAAVATVMRCAAPMSVKFESISFQVRVDGQEPGPGGSFALTKGAHLVLATVSDYLTHQGKDKPLELIPSSDRYKLVNPLDPAHANPWCLVELDGEPWVGDDMHWIGQPHPERDAARERYQQAAAQAMEQVKTPADFKKHLAPLARLVEPEQMLHDDPHRLFVRRRVLAEAGERVQAPAALMHDNAAVTTIHPSPQGDIELAYDLGEQNCGYYSFELMAPAGTIMDLFGVEYITPDGWIQHTADNRNGLRYVCRQGLNRFVSLKRRSGRYLFLTLRAQSGPVSIRKIELIESTYPVQEIGEFTCSDPALDRIWEISRRTLKLCMEDTYTDCPLYEQTLWVGDARNEALFALPVFDAQDLTRRCIRLAGQSLERYPLVGCQVPSAWDCLLPAWSFLWGISVWDYYFYSGDLEFLRECWGWVQANLKGAQALTDEHGLFSGPFWNMLDWSGMDDTHLTVIHNSQLLVGAIDAALKCARALDDKDVAAWLRPWRAKLKKAINRQWDPARAAYPDALLEADGAPSPVTSQHTSLLAILHDIIEPANYDAALRNTLDPPKDMVTIGSPFAIQFAYETMEKAGHPQAVLDSIMKNYLPMLRAGSTTVWETFEGRLGLESGAPTRSHCHAWSAAPLYFLSRIVLGLRQSAVGAAAFEVSPWVAGQQWARGTQASARGPVHAAWAKDGSTLAITAQAPRGVRLSFKPNPSHKGLKVTFNGRAVTV